jgi:hypothetical protein
MEEGAARCRHCSAPLSQEESEVAALLQCRVDQACSDADKLKTCAVATYILLGLSLVPWVGMYVFWGFVAALPVLGVMLARWQLKFGRILTIDPGFKQARQARNAALLMLLFALPLGFTLRLLSLILWWLTFEYLLR